MRKWLTFVLIGVLLLGVLPISATAQEANGPARVGLRSDAPEYALHGPYWVGTRDYLIPEGDSAFGVTVWYPALNPEGKPEENVYFVSKEYLNGLGIPDDSENPIAGHALTSAAPDVESGPYPLVVFSPMLRTWRQSTTYLMEHLASEGFVVMAMEHRGENFSEYWQGAYYRPAETLLTIQFADQLTADGGDLGGLIDVDKLAIIGASSGGWTALVGGGAQMNFSGCLSFNEEAQGTAWASNCQEYAPKQDELAGMFRLSVVPDGSWPQYYDPRVDAVISIVPYGDIWGTDYQGVASVTVPTMVFASSSDSVNPPTRAAYPIYEHLGSASKSLVMFEGADHPLYHDECGVAPWVADVWGLGWLCADGVWAKDLAHDLFDHFTAAFLLAELYGDADAAAALSPDAVQFPGITYETTGF